MIYRVVGTSALFLFSMSAAWGQASPAKPPAPESTRSSAQAKQPDRARSYYHYMLARRYRELANYYNRSGLSARTVNEYRRAIEADPESPFLRTELAEYLAGLGNSDEAIKECEGALEIEPNNVEAHRLLGKIYLSTLRNAPSSQTQTLIRKAIPHLELVTRLAPDDADSLSTLAYLYRMNNELEKAEAVLQNLLETSPDSPQALSNLVRLYSDQGDYEAIVRLLELLPQSRLSAQSLSWLAIAFDQTGREKKAVSAYRAALDKEPGNHRLRQYYARALLSQQDFAGAKAELKKVVEFNPEDGESYRLLADIHRLEGNFEEAEQAIVQAKRLRPDSPETVYSEVRLRETLGEEEAAIEVLQDALKKTRKASGKYTPAESQTRAVFLERLGSAYRTLEKYEKALEPFEAMRELGLESALRAEWLIVDTLRLSGQLPKALKAAQSATRKYSQDQGLKVHYATLLALDGQVDRALTLLESIQGDLERDRDLMMALAQIHFQIRRYRAAEEWVRKVLSNSATDEFALFLLGSIYEREKKYDLAEQQFKKILVANPLSGMAANYLGYMLADRGVRLEESIRYIQEALQREPKNGAYLDSLGWAYFKLEKFDLAEIHLEAAARRITRDPVIHEHLGHLYYRTGRRDRARDAWERALKTWPTAHSSEFDAQRARDLRRRLKSLKKNVSVAP